ncbi:hypothetical protein V9K67_17255 [Paraflavisolibacter sp. H34]|uniref:hypothetical protein n=1 Tax=Huijunlia imazamoxiresistens TaxID=3127457 RepID=UPI00301A0FF4
MSTPSLKPCILLLLLCCFVGTINAQRNILSGYLVDSLTQLPITGGTLHNAQTGQKVRTGLDGYFRLGVKPDDLIYALAPNYHFDTLHYSVLFQDTVKIHLAPSEKMLEGVTVSAYRQYQMDSLQRRAAFEEARGSSPSLVKHDPSLGFGVALNLDRVFKKKSKNKVRAEKSFNRMEEEAYIDFRCPPQMVTLYTGLKGEPLAEFMNRYRPSYDWLREHTTREQMIAYLNESMKAWKASPSAGSTK